MIQWGVESCGPEKVERVCGRVVLGKYSVPAVALLKRSILHYLGRFIDPTSIEKPRLR